MALQSATIKIEGDKVNDPAQRTGLRTAPVRGFDKESLRDATLK